MAKRKSKKSKVKIIPIKANQVPATMGVIREFRGEMMSRFLYLDKRLDRHDIKFKSIDDRFDRIDQRFDEMDYKWDKRFTEFESRIESRFELFSQDIKSTVHQIKLIVEEQGAYNRYVLDGYAQIYDRQEKLEKEIKEKC